jgi:hypothetical protein
MNETPERVIMAVIYRGDEFARVGASIVTGDRNFDSGECDVALS